MAWVNLRALLQLLHRVRRPMDSGLNRHGLGGLGLNRIERRGGLGAPVMMLMLDKVWPCTLHASIPMAAVGFGVSFPCLSVFTQCLERRTMKIMMLCR